MTWTTAEGLEIVEASAEFDNATLLQVASPGTLAGNGDPGTPVAVWTGSVGGCLKRTVKDTRSDESQVRDEVAAL